MLCDAFRHPAVLAKQAVGLDHASGGRFELGLGWGSWASEFEAFGVGSTANRERFDRLAETVEVVQALWSGSAVEFEGAHHRLAGAVQRPTPTRPIPLVIGGSGPKTLRLVAEHATWWNCPWYALDRFEDLRARVGDARISLQQMVAHVPEGADPDDVRAVTERRFGPGRTDILLGTSRQIVDALAAQRAAGVERFYLWFTDFAAPETLAAVGAEVLPALR